MRWWGLVPLFDIRLGKPDLPHQFAKPVLRVVFRDQIVIHPVPDITRQIKVEAG